MSYTETNGSNTSSCGCSDSCTHVGDPLRAHAPSNTTTYPSADNGSNESHSPKNSQTVFSRILKRHAQFSAQREPNCDSVSGNEQSTNRKEGKSNNSESTDQKQEPSPGNIGLDWHEDISLPQTKAIWQGLEGMAITSFGIVIPALVLLLSCAYAPKRITLVLLNHPLETIAELLLVASIPFINFLVWSTLCKAKPILNRRLIVGLGTAIGTAGIISLVCLSGVFVRAKELSSSLGSDIGLGVIWIAMLSLLSGAAALYLAYKIRSTRDFERSRKQVVACTLVGTVLSAAAFVACEARPFSVRLAERLAVSATAKDRNQGMHWLKLLNPERELRIECSDSRAAGLAGMFIPIKSISQHQLYFAVTGKPFSFSDDSNPDLSSMPDDYLSRHVVGEKISGLTLTRSTLSGTVHPNTLSSTINWTFVLKNDTQSAQEARAEFGLPPGATLTGLTVWNKGESEDAVFVASGKADVPMTNLGYDNRAMATDLGHGRVLVNCYPVPQEEELKVRVSMVVPLKPDSSKAASLAIPKLIDTNFDLTGEHQLRLRSTAHLSSSFEGLKERVNSDQEKFLFGDLPDKKLKDLNLSISTQRPENYKAIAVFDKVATRFEQEEQLKREQQEEAQQNSKHKMGDVVVMIDGSKGVQSQLQAVHEALANKNDDESEKKARIVSVEPRFLVEDVSSVAVPAPGQLVVVVDGSIEMKDYISDISTALSKLPNNLPVSLIVASQENDKLMKPETLANALKGLKNVQFAGGQDNLKAVVEAAELAGESRHGAVLWIHGPQPTINPEIYIMAPYVATPTFYELALGAGTDNYEFFKNHSEIGPFAQVPRNTPNVAVDLESFFSKWSTDNNNYVVKLSQTTAAPAESITASPEESKELLALYAAQQTATQMSERHFGQAAVVAVNYGIVSPVSSALVNSQLRRAADAVQSAPQLQGATNGTIAPQAGEATVVQGVNTAGTVRVNNVANLEALLNIIANFGEIGSIILGAVMLVNGFTSKTSMQLGGNLALGRRERILAGVAIIVMGLAMPGLINWLVASARDANLFS